LISHDTFATIGMCVWGVSPIRLIKLKARTTKIPLVGGVFLSL